MTWEERKEAESAGPSGMVKAVGWAPCSPDSTLRRGRGGGRAGGVGLTRPQVLDPMRLSKADLGCEEGEETGPAGGMTFHGGGASLVSGMQQPEADHEDAWHQGWGGVCLERRGNRKTNRGSGGAQARVSPRVATHLSWDLKLSVNFLPQCPVCNLL